MLKPLDPNGVLTKRLTKLQGKLLYFSFFNSISGPRASEYKTTFGERGSKPVDRLSRTSQMPPVPKSEDGLK